MRLPRPLAWKHAEDGSLYGAVSGTKLFRIVLTEAQDERPFKVWSLLPGHTQPGYVKTEQEGVDLSIKMWLSWMKAMTADVQGKVSLWVIASNMRDMLETLDAQNLEVWPAKDGEDTSRWSHAWMALQELEKEITL